jgi:flagellar assembly factor FliW
MKVIQQENELKAKGVPQGAPALKVATSRFGELAIPEDKVINFVHGIPGFERLKRYVLLDHDSDGVFKWLQALDDPDVAFLMTDPRPYKPDYTVPTRKNDMAELGFDAKAEEPLIIYVMVCVAKDEKGSKTVSINLKGPILFNSSKMRGLQCIIDNEKYQANHVISL